MFAPFAITLQINEAVLCEESQRYCDTLVNNPFVQNWIAQGRAEKEPLRIAYASNM
jgi:hypothetical protein